MEKNESNRVWAKEFKEYTEMIVNHPNYTGLFYERNNDTQIKWMVTGKSDKGQLRRQWWDAKCKEHKIPIKAGCYAKIAVALHPTKMHVCQICGKSLDIRYIYPNKNLLAKINDSFDVAIESYSQHILDIIDRLAKTSKDIEKFKHILKIKDVNVKTADSLKEYIHIHYVTLGKKPLSPGVMSNSPDRYDGFHSDGNCCRRESDKGRHKDNLSRYTQDRRVYENWADGDWKQADRLMALFAKYGLSADHIGPISLGFCHRPKFNPMTKEANSSKNNRMSLSDVKTLIEDEANGEQVVSWHSQYIWNALKERVATDKDAVKLSDFMRKNLHHILTCFSIISEAGHNDFLKQYLNPQFSYFDYSFENFDPATGQYSNAISKNLTGKNQQNNADRYIYIAFEELDNYKDVKNRKIHKWTNVNVDDCIDRVIISLRDAKPEQADLHLRNAFKLLADDAANQW